MYNVTKTFTDGILKGTTITEQTSVKFTEGTAYRGALGSSSYVVTKVTRV